jgi:hypothetical protein
MDCRVLTCWRSISYVAGHKQGGSLLFQCIESNFLVQFVCGYVCSIVYKADSWQSEQQLASTHHSVPCVSEKEWQKAVVNSMKAYIINNKISRWIFNRHCATCTYKGKYFRLNSVAKGKGRRGNATMLIDVHLFQWIPVQTVNWAIIQCYHHITWGRHRRGDGQFGRCDAHHSRRRHEMWLMLPQLQKQITWNMT